MHHMSNALRSGIITLASRLGWEVQRRPNGQDLFDKLLSFTHHSFPSRLCIDKKNGITKAGEIKYFKVVVHPKHYQKDLENVTEGIRPAINQKTKTNLHSHSGFKGFIYSDDNKEPCGKGYQVMGISSLELLLSQLVGRDPSGSGESRTRAVWSLIVTVRPGNRKEVRDLVRSQKAPSPPYTKDPRGPDNNGGTLTAPGRD